MTNASCGGSGSGLAVFSCIPVDEVGAAAGEGFDETDEAADLSTEAGAAFGDGVGVEELESCARTLYIKTAMFQKKK